MSNVVTTSIIHCPLSTILCQLSFGGERGQALAARVHGKIKKR